MANVRTVAVRLRMETGDYKRDADQAGQETDKLGRKIKKTGKEGKADLDQLATGAALVGTALVGMAGAAIYAAAQFDSQMSEVAAVSGAAADQMGRLRQAALDAGAATVFSAREAAQAEAELAKAGISTADILGGALRGALDLASAGSLELAQAAEIAAAAMNTFDLKGKDVGHIADVLASAANKSAAGVEDLGQGLQQVGLVAAQVDFTLEETVALLAAFADRGLKGSDGATSLKTALMRLAAPTKTAADKMAELGISFYDADGNMIGAVETAGQLRKAFGDLAPAQRNAAMQTIFGSDAIRAANVLFEEGEDGIRDYVQAVNDQGAASRVAATKLDNLKGDVEELTGALETLFIEAGSGSQGPLRALVQQATGIANAFGAMPDGLKSAVVAMAAVSGVGLLTGAAYLKLRVRVKEYGEELSKLGPMQGRFGRGLQSLTGLAGKTGLALAGLQLVGSALQPAFGDLKIKTEDLQTSLAEFGKTGKLGGELARQFAGDYDRLGVVFDSVAGSSHGFGTALDGLTGVTDKFTWSATKNAERIAALDASLRAMRDAGNHEAASEAFFKLWEAAEKAGVPLEDFKALFPQYLDGITALGTATDKTGGHTKDLTGKNETLIKSFQDLGAEVDDIISTFETYNKTNLDLREAQRNAEAAVDDLSDALRESGGSMDITTEKGRKAQAAADALAEAAAAVAQKTYDQTQSIDDANAAWENYITQLRKTLRQANYTDEQIQAVIDTIAQMPPSKTVEVKAKVSIDWTAVFNKAAVAAAAKAKEILGTFLPFYRRFGGVLEHAQTGLLKDAHIAPPMGRTLYAYNEPETGGEAFVPKRGDYGRSMSILSHAAGWYGADVVPQGAMRGASYGGGSAKVEVLVRAAPGADRGVMAAVVEGLRFDVRTLGQGSVQTYLGQRNP